MPRRKPRNAIEKIPGRMIASDSRKYQLRRPTIFIASSGRLGRGRPHAVERETSSEPQPGENLEELLGGHDRREHAPADADGQRDREALDQGGAEEVEHEARDQRRDVGVADGW